MAKSKEVKGEAYKQKRTKQQTPEEKSATLAEEGIKQDNKLKKDIAIFLCALLSIGFLYSIYAFDRYAMGIYKCSEKAILSVITFIFLEVLAIVRYITKYLFNINTTKEYHGILNKNYAPKKEQ